MFIPPRNQPIGNQFGMNSIVPNTEPESGDELPLASRRAFLSWLALLGVSLPVSPLLADPSTALFFSEDDLPPIDGVVNLSIFRPQDLLHLKMSFLNFKKGNSNQLERTGGGDAFLAVFFQPQSVAEQAFNQIEPRQYPAAAFLSGPSRLVFKIPANVTTIPLTAEKMLDWSKYELVVNGRALAPNKFILTGAHFNTGQTRPNANLNANNLTLNTRANKVLSNYQQSQNLNSAKLRTQRQNENYRLASEEQLEDLIKETFKNTPSSVNPRSIRMGEPDQNETAIELPWRVILSPNQFAGFAHDHKLRLFAEFVNANKGKPTQFEVYEMWHTRLGMRTTKGIDESEAARKILTLRAIWAYGINEDYSKLPSPDANFKTALSNDDRHQIVHKSSNWNIPNYTPQSIEVNRLMLSALGGWLDSNFTPLSYAALNLIKWSHLATMGRDHYVEVVKEGYVLPFGHRAAYVKITERKTEAGFALNRTREFVIISEVEKKYLGNTFMAFPFRQIRIHTLVTPNLDQPIRAFEKSVTAENSNFAITVGGKGFPFKISGVDPEGREIDFELPLVFIGTNVSGKANKATLDKLLKQYNAYAFMQSQGVEPSTIASARGQKMAIANSLVPGDTSFEIDQLDFGVQYLESSPTGFYPKLNGIDLYEPAYESLTGKKEPVNMELVDDTSPTNSGQVFAKVSGSINFNFAGNADKAGGALVPNFRFTGLSKIQGAVGGDLNDIQNLNFNPSSFFTPNGQAEAKLFGVVPLSGLMKKMNLNVEGYVSDIKTAVSKVEDARAKLEQAKESGGAALDAAKNALSAESAALQDKMSKYTAKMPVFKNVELPDKVVTQMLWNGETEPEYKLAGGLLTLKSNTPSETIKINTTISRPRNGAAPIFTTSSSVNNFNVLLAGIIQVNFKKVGFSVNSQAKTDISVDMQAEPMSFLGPLSFLNDLKNLIPADGFSDPPFLDVGLGGVKTGYTLAVPDLSLGAFMLRNISLGAMVNLPFTGSPMSLRFNFCERHQPFTLTVSALGGGGFFGLELDLKGLRSLEAALEFGAAVALNLGVASGAVSVMAGIYFKMTIDNGNSVTSLTGYVRINGALSVLGLITVSVMFYLGLEYNVTTGKAWGEATLMVKVEVLFFSKTVSLTTRREFAGSGADPTFGMMVSKDDWNTYWDAFAA